MPTDVKLLDTKIAEMKERIQKEKLENAQKKKELEAARKTISEGQTYEKSKATMASTKKKY